ncbi:MFS transporter [Corynebacteriales bacterium D3-21]|uniref:MFS transporter n=2 Tax=Speluncibacter jeojiensis TaxID=2710754 RepID=A0A9X4M331_9ACTN|nr:MFS transporter [Corynebacteriales bacterium D3-21]
MMTTPRPTVPRQIWVLVAAAFVIAVGYGLIAPVLPEYARSFDVGVTGASVIISAFAFCRLVFAPVSGRLVHLLGERPTYLTGLFIVACSTGACAFAQSYWQLLVFRGLGGIGSTMFTVSAMGLLVRLAPVRARGRVNGLYATAFLLGGIGGPIIGGLLAGLGMAVPFLVYAVALLIAMAVVYFQLRDVGGKPAGQGAAHAAMTVREALAHRTYRAALGSNFANGWSALGVRVALVPLFVTAFGGGPGLAGLSLAAFSVGNAVALTLGGRWADVRGRKPLVLAGLLITGIATAALGLSESVAPFLIVSTVAGLGSGLLNPPQQAAVADVIGSRRSGGTVLAGFQMMSDVGAIAGPILAGALAEHVSYAAAFAVTGAISLLALPAWLRAPETLVVPEQSAAHTAEGGSEAGSDPAGDGRVSGTHGPPPPAHDDHRR